MVEQVEPLERELQVASLAQLDVLGKADVHVEVRVATQGVVRNDVAVTGVIALRLGYLQGAVYGGQLGCRLQIIRIAVQREERAAGATAAQDQHIVPRGRKIRTGRSRLQDWRKHHSPRQVYRARTRA